MRISDWSSDVCSSDLAVDRIDLDVAALAVDHVAVGIDKEAAVAGVVDLRAADARLDREAAVAGDREIERRFGLDEIDQQRVVEGTSVSVRVAHGGRRMIKKKK